VTWLGLQAAPDWQLTAVAKERDYIVVTNNRRDFIRLYAEQELHNGLLILVDQVERDGQHRLFNIALDTAETLPDLTNMLIEVHADGSVETSVWAKGVNTPP